MERLTPTRRLAIIVACLGGLLGLAVWFGTLGPAPAVGAYPSAGDLATDYDQYVGKQVVVGGHVVATNPVMLRTTTQYGTLEVTITGLETTVTPGETLRVFGVAKPERTIAAHRSVTIPQSGFRYTYTVSFLAGVWVLTRLGRHWRLNRDAWALEPRANLLSLTGGVRKLRTIVQTKMEDSRDA